MADEPINPLDVMLVVDDDVIDRFGSIVRHLCVGMLDEPVRMTVLTRSQRKIEDAVGPARVLRIPKSIWPWKRLNPAVLLDELEIEPPDLVHCLSVPLLEWARPLATAWRSAMAVHLTDLLDVHRLTSHAPASPLMVVTATRSVEKALIERRPDLRDSTRFVPVGVPAQAEPSCLAQPDRVPAVVVTAPLTRDSGVDALLRALQAVVRAGQEVQVFLLSSGPAERSLRRLAEDLGVLHHVTFAGHMTDWAQTENAIRAADLYILPGERRRFSASRITAMACGLAILAPGGTSEDYLIDGVTARLFDPNRSQDLTDKWIGLLDDRTAARQLAETALDYARAHHQASTMATAIAWFYREQLGGLAGIA